MGKFHAAIACASILAIVSQSVGAAELIADATTAATSRQLYVAEQDQGPSLPSNTEIWFNPVSEISSKDLRSGQSFGVRVARDVYLNNAVVVPRGTPGTATVTRRSGTGMFGRSAKVEFELDTLDYFGTSVPLHGHHRLAGEGNTGWTVAMTLLVCLVCGAAITGHSAYASEASEFRAYSSKPLRLTMGPAAAPMGYAAGSGGAGRTYPVARSGSYGAYGVTRRPARAPSGFCYDVPRDYFGTGSVQHPIPNADTPACWEIEG